MKIKDTTKQMEDWEKDFDKDFPDLILDIPVLDDNGKVIKKEYTIRKRLKNKIYSLLSQSHTQYVKELEGEIDKLKKVRVYKQVMTYEEAIKKKPYDLYIKKSEVLSLLGTKLKGENKI